MPKQPKSMLEKVRVIASKYSDEKLSEDDGVLVCRACIQRLSTKASSIKDHLQTIKHKENLKLKAVQQILNESITEHTFTSELCRAFVSADINLDKLSNQNLKAFLEKYTGRIIPNHKTIKDSYLDESYSTILDKIRNQIGDGPIWVSVDVATLVDERSVAHVIIGKLSPHEALPSFLLHTAVLERMNNESITIVFTDTLTLLWPDGIKYSQVLLLVTDRSGCMQKVADVLSTIYNRMVHVTCVAHDLQLVCELIRPQYQMANEFIAVLKKIFKKSPLRIQLLKDSRPNIPFPSSLFNNRWSTWLIAAEYYAEHFNLIVGVLKKLNDQDNEAIKSAQAMIETKGMDLFTELTAIKTHYSILVQSIAALQTRGTPLNDSLKIISVVSRAIMSIPQHDRAVREKLASVLQKNKGLVMLSAVADMNMTKLEKHQQFKNISPEKLLVYKFAPIVLAEVKRSFSIYKSFMSDNRRRFTFENIRKHIIVQVNNSF